jgi:hypothetical protein
VLRNMNYSSQHVGAPGLGGASLAMSALSGSRKASITVGSVGPSISTVRECHSAHADAPSGRHSYLQPSAVIVSPWRNAGQRLRPHKRQLR